VGYIISVASNLGFSVSEVFLVQLFAGTRGFNISWNTLFARHEDVRGGGGGAIATFTHKADSRWNWMVRCMPQQPYRYGKYNRHAVNRRVVGAQGQSGRFEVDLNFCHLLGIEPRLLWTSSSKTTTTTTTTTLSLSLSLSIWRIFNIGSLNILFNLVNMYLWFRGCAAV